MVQPRYKVVLYFAAFVLPALLVYAIFFLFPFAQGIRISFTNWDGLTPRTPISMPKPEFEKKILEYRALGGDSLTFTADYSRPPRINGKPVDYAPPKAFDSPFIQEDWNSGVVTLQKGERRLVLDFN